MAKNLGYNQQPIATAKMFTASWTERDEAILVELINRKIREMRFEIKRSNSPYAKNKLRRSRQEYRKLLDKIERGDYDPDILAAELKTHHEYNKLQDERKRSKIGKYTDAYADVDFDFSTYFSKARYFGASLPIIMIVLLIVFVAVIFSSAYLAPATLKTIQDPLSNESRITLTSVGYIKLESGPHDYRVDNDGRWPTGSYVYEEQALEDGELYRDEDLYAPPKVLLHDDLGMESIDITAVDLFKALFRTEIFSQNRVDYIEDLDVMQGYSWYYIRYIRDRADDIKIQKGEDGKYDWVAIVRRIATFGTIYALVLMLLACVVELFINIGRLFSYTSRRVHFWPVLIVLCGIATFIFPALLELEALNSEALSLAFSNYFTVNWMDFIYGDSLIAFNVAFPIFLLVPFIMAIIPLFFKNRPAKTVAFVPKGNKPHTYAGHDQPTKPGQPGASRIPSGSKRYADAGSKPGYSAKYPNR